MRVLVTGGAGFIGSHIVDRLLKQGCDVWVVDNLSHGRRDHVPQSAHFIAGDVLHSDEWLDSVGHADVLIHLAAQISVPVSETNPEEDVRINVLGTVAMLLAARRLKCREFRLASSAAIYGDNPRVPLAEDEMAAPLSYYGLDKWIAEQYVLHERSHMQGTILRMANVYGPRQRTQGEGGVVAIFCEALAEGRMPVIEGDGDQTRDFIAVTDVARAFCHRLGQTGAGGTYNIGTESATSVVKLWQLLAREADVDVRSVGHGPARQGDIRHSRLKTARATDWGFQPTVTLEEGLATTYAWFCERLQAE